MTLLSFDRKITSVIGKAIRESKYLRIHYENLSGQRTDFWIGIIDIYENDQLLVNMFNVAKEEPKHNVKISISRIKQAEILRFSHCDIETELIDKILNDERLEHYQFEKFDSNILQYYLDCYKANCDPFLHKKHLIEEIDLGVLEKESPYYLNDAQQRKIITEIYLDDYHHNKDYELALCEFSIDIQGKGKFVVAYRKLTFDPILNTLKISSKTYFNSNFYIHNISHNLSYYTEISSNDFETVYLKDKFEAIEIIRENFKKGELPNTKPEIVVMGYSQIDLSAIYDNINTDCISKEMSIPIKAFFQQLSLVDTRSKLRPNLVLYDKNVNIDQLRTIYNSQKYPITYVQGPPGTGKTQTILNIVVNCLISNKTLLISSNNNIPIDGIYDKLDLGKYNNKEILIPILRLGNEKYIIKALNKIRQLYEFETSDVPKDELLNKLKLRSSERNKHLDESLNLIDQRIELSQNLEFVKSLLKQGSYHLLESEMYKIQSKLDSIPEINDEDLRDIFEVVKGNRILEQFFYYESLKYIKRLKHKKFNTLKDIVYSEDDNERVKQFNKWIQDDFHLIDLLSVFPIILTTNLSSRKLGWKYKFELLVIDEAGQCDVATSLIPISKCKKMVLIGDTNQLKPIISFDESKNESLMITHRIPETYNYFTNSILSVYQQLDNISRNILLSYHYRCGRKIINYSNQRFYENKLNLERITENGSLLLLKVKNLNSADKNSNLEEACEIINFIIKNQLKDVFILTPFRNQKNLIDEMLKIEKHKRNIDHSVNCGTIHQVQGQENKTIILSTSISQRTQPRTFDWIKNNSELLNVGVTRAKDNLIVAVDKAAVDILSRKDDDLFALIKYIEDNGTSKIAMSNSNRFTIGFSNDSQFENEFYKTMQHFCTVKGVKFERNVKVVSLFPTVLNERKLNNKEFDGVLYESQIPKIVFEINGAEHFNNKRTIESDKLKMELLKSKGITLITIPNQYVKHYEFISNLIGKINGHSYQTTLFEDYENYNT